MEDSSPPIWVTTIKILFLIAGPTFAKSRLRHLLLSPQRLLASPRALATNNKMHLYRLLIIYHSSTLKSTIKTYKYTEKYAFFIIYFIL